MSLGLRSKRRGEKLVEAIKNVSDRGLIHLQTLGKAARQQLEDGNMDSESVTWAAAQA
jgi:hypothetical protein